jgi:hypothetical protein
MKEFLWIPGQGVDPAALARLRTHFRRPSEPMGEAWFMGEQRKMFGELQGDLDRLPVTSLQDALVEIASGTSSFGEMVEWTDWYHHLLATVLPRSHESHAAGDLLEHLITAFMALYRHDIHPEPYKGFREDALSTLGRCMMDSSCWNGGDIVVGNLLHRSNRNPRQVWLWWDASGDFSASMFFCLKYLPEPLVAPWLNSALAIASPHWRAQMMVWMVGSHDVLNGDIRWPSQLAEQAYPSVNWTWSHCLKPEAVVLDANGKPPNDHFIPADSRDRALQVFKSFFQEDVYLEWLSSISTVLYLETELADIPSTFEQLFVHT